jgi:hypothetical protein
MENIKFNKKKVFFFNCTGIWLFECLKNMQKWFYSLIFFNWKQLEKLKLYYWNTRYGRGDNIYIFFYQSSCDFCNNNLDSFWNILVALKRAV